MVVLLLLKRQTMLFGQQGFTYPFNPFIFGDEDFAPANVLDLAANTTNNENNAATGVTLDVNME